MVDATVDFETSLAELRLLEGQESIPQEFAKNMLTILIWDNLDFGEETLYRQGTTYHAIGLRIETHITESACLSRRELLKKGTQCLKPSTGQIEEYHLQKGRDFSTYFMTRIMHRFTTTAFARL